MALLKTFFRNARFVSFQYRTGYNVRIKELCRVGPCLPEHRNFFTDICMRDRQGDFTPTFTTDNKEALDKDAKTEVPKKWFAPDEQDFESIKEAGAFVDRSLLLEKLLNVYVKDGKMAYAPVLITAPRRFGKSSNLSMVKYFLEVQCDENGEAIANVANPVKDTTNYKLFEDMKIMNHTKIVDECFGRHPVIHLDFKGAEFSNHEELLSHCRRVLYNANEQHTKYLYGKLDEAGNHFFSLWSCKNYHTLNEDNVKQGLILLAKHLYNKFHRKVFILVDEYDAIAREAIDKMHEEEEVQAAYKLLVAMLGPAIKGGTAYVQGALLTGVFSILSIGVAHELNNVSIFRFLHNHKFTEFYGLIESEIDRIATLHEKTHGNRNVFVPMKEWFNAYVTLDGKLTMYALRPVGNAVEAGMVKNYWTNTGNFYYLPHILKMPQILGYILDLLNDKDITIQLVKKIQLQAVMLFNSILKSPRQRIPNLNLLFSMLPEEGYLSIVKPEEKTQEVQLIEQRKVKVTLPNKQIKTEICYCIKRHFTTSWGFDRVKIEACARFFEKVKSFRSTEDEGLKLKLKQFHSNLFALFRGFSEERIFELNKSHLHCLMYFIASVVPFTLDTKHRLYHKRKLMGTLDLLMLSDDGFAIIIELKYDRNGVKAECSRAGLEQILSPSTNYLSVLKTYDVDNYFLISISIDDKRQPSLSCLLNDKDINHAVHFPCYNKQKFFNKLS